MSTDVKDLVKRLRAGCVWSFEFSDVDEGATERIMNEAATALEAQAEKIERLTNEKDELQLPPWPEWVSKVLAVIRARSGYDGYDDAIDGVDLPAELEETMAVLEREADRQMQDARAKRETDLHKGAADHYRKKCAEHRANADAAERERDALKAENERLREALTLAANRLDRLALEDMPLKADATDWGVYARAALHPTQGGE